jgi:hypothetical protein
MPVGSRVAVDILAKASWLYRLNSTHTKNETSCPVWRSCQTIMDNVKKRERERENLYE